MPQAPQAKAMPKAAAPGASFNDGNMQDMFSMMERNHASGDAPASAPSPKAMPKAKAAAHFSAAYPEPLPASSERAIAAKQLAELRRQFEQQQQQMQADMHPNPNPNLAPALALALALTTPLPLPLPLP